MSIEVTEFRNGRTRRRIIKNSKLPSAEELQVIAGELAGIEFHHTQHETQSAIACCDACRLLAIMKVRERALMECIRALKAQP